ncbi:MAG: ArsR/SmtB family transcription factor [Merdibacter sp.]
MNEHDYLALSAVEAHQIRRQEPSARSVRALSDLFSVFADTTRIRIMYALYADELCVGDIASILGLSQSAISHQLRILKDARLVASRREGKTVFYALDDDHVRAILATGMEHVEEK